MSHDGFVPKKPDGTRPQGYVVKVEEMWLPTKCANAVAELFGRALPVLTKHVAYRRGEKIATSYRRIHR